MKTAQEQDIHCGTCTVKGDIVACLATPCSVRSSWFANSQAAEIERLTGCLEKANIQAEKFEREWYLRGDENEALKADAERYKAVSSVAYVGIAPHPKPHEVWCLRLPNPTGCTTLDAAIDAMRKS